jgi:hypothetical protein
MIIQNYIYKSKRVKNKLKLEENKLISKCCRRHALDKLKPKLNLFVGLFKNKKVVIPTPL